MKDKKIIACQIVFLLMCILLVVACKREPPSFQLTWTAPSFRVDGSPLSLDEIAAYGLYVLPPKKAAPIEVMINSRGESENMHVWEADKPVFGKYCFYLITVDTAGLSSRNSETLCLNAKKTNKASPFSLVVIQTK